MKIDIVDGSLDPLLNLEIGHDREDLAARGLRLTPRRNFIAANWRLKYSAILLIGLTMQGNPDSARRYVRGLRPAARPFVQ
jgi:hypothetical protein